MSVKLTCSRTHEAFAIQSIMTFSPAHFGAVAGPTAFFAILAFFHPEGLSPEGTAVLASTAWIAIWWITEAMPIAATALLPIVLFPLTGALQLQATTTSYGHRYIFLYIGGFLLAIAIEKWGLHKRIALNIIHAIGTNVTSIILGFMIATASLSMWISNTATSVMMLPIGMAIIAQLRDNPATEVNENRKFGKALMLGIAYSASIGGMATLVGTPPNLVLAGVVQGLYGIEITFSQWISFGLPISLVLLALCWFYLTRIAFSFDQKSFPGGRAEIKQQLKAFGSMSFEEKLVLVVFSLTAMAWISRSFLQKELGWFPRLDDTIIAMIAGLILFLLPTKKGKGTALLSWEDTKNLPWGIVLLFGGGMALAEGFKSSGLAAWVGGQMTLLEGIPLILLVLILVASVNFLTEITSNLATTSMLVPILAPMALAINVHPFILLVSATVASSCAFMLPVATPPNAVVFGSGYLRIPDMVRVGLWMNLISILLLSLFVYFLLPLVWGIDPGVFPASWK
ncbi:MAG: sodium-dependent dicarboxylate transporter 2/3/5 [Verrucomicrobiales bacterium]|jgi:sodium-dependent dicarboxylate transporter 2/3/5